MQRFRFCGFREGFVTSVGTVGWHIGLGQSLSFNGGHAVAQLFEVLLYKPEDRWFD
jgi:hypothetical protein